MSGARSCHQPLDYARLREQVPMRQVLRLIGFRPTGCRGVQWRGDCPLPHCLAREASSKDRSSGRAAGNFSVNTERHVFRCFGCNCCGNQLDLWMAFCGQPLHPAALLLCKAASIDPPQLPSLSRVDPSAEPT